MGLVVSTEVLAAQAPPAATDVAWFQVTTVCDEPGRPEVGVPEKVQSAFLAYVEDNYSRPAGQGSDRLYRYSLPRQPRRFLYLHEHDMPTSGERVTFWLYDAATHTISRNPPAQHTRWLAPEIATGTVTNRFGDPYVSFRDITGDGIPEIVSFEAEHSGTDDWQQYYHYYQFTSELSLKRILTRPVYVCVHVPDRPNGSLHSKWAQLGEGRLRIDVFASGLPSIRDGARVATYTCEQSATALPFALTAHRLEHELGIQSWALDFFMRTLGDE
jgi:hypothetical protein